MRIVIAGGVGYLAWAEYDRRQAAKAYAAQQRHNELVAYHLDRCIDPKTKQRRLGPDVQSACDSYLLLVDPEGEEERRVKRAAAAALERLRQACFAAPGGPACADYARASKADERRRTGEPEPPPFVPPTPEQLKDIEHYRTACYRSTTPEPCQDFARIYGYNPRERNSPP